MRANPPDVWHYLGVWLFAALVGCGSVPIRPNQPTDEPWTNYVIGQIQDAPTGSTMVEWIGRARFLRGYRMVAPVTVERIGVQPPKDPIVWPARYIYEGPCPEGRYVVTTPNFYREAIGIIVADDGTIPCEMSVLQIQGAKRGREWRASEANSRPFIPAPFLDDLKQSPIKWELIYSGRSGNEIALSYREYASGTEGTFARPAFYQDLKYDLATSDRIVFRSLELEIVEASNAGVRFRVLRDGERSAPQWPGTNLAPQAP